jgi:hypothetical protein
VKDRTFLLLPLVLILNSTFAFASAAQVKGRSQINSCGYYSNTTGYFEIEYNNSNIQWGSKVFLHYGILNDSEPVKHDTKWEFIQTVPMESVRPFTWSVNIHQIFHARTSPGSFNKLAFVFLIENPSGEITYDRGNFSNYGYQYVRLPQPVAPCQEPQRSMDELAVMNLQKN